MLELRGVSAGYGGATVLRAVDLVVPDGATVAMLGPNGAGKTTLLRVASGLLPPSSGQLLVDDTELTGASADRIAAAGVCHVPEGRGVFPSLTVRENLHLQAHGKQVEAAVERAVWAFPRLGERLGQVVGTMSGGEQQMLALARTYVQSPRTVLLDEVSMGLAPRIVDEIFESLRRLTDEGIALLLVEQYVSKALSMADYVVLLSRGRVSLVAEPQELADEDVFDHYMGASA